jgi:hypothetical protein
MRQRLEPHPPDDELLLAADSELPPAKQASVGAHLSRCTVCDRRLRHMHSVLHDAGAVYQSELAVTRASTSDPRARLEHALGELSRTWEHSWPTRLRRALAASHAWAGLGLAASAVLVMAFLSGPLGPSGRTEHAGIGNTPSLPMPSLTPGSVAALTSSELCDGARPSRLVPIATRDRVLASYRMQDVAADAYELDALITPELGGTTNAENLWPQMYASPVWNARVKDELELLLPQLVCRGEVDLARAQKEIATDWIAAYKRYFKTDAPLQAHIGPPLDEDDELEFEIPYVVAQTSLVLSTSGD